MGNAHIDHRRGFGCRIMKKEGESILLIGDVNIAKEVRDSDYPSANWSDILSGE